MADGDNRARQDTTYKDAEIAGGVAKANPTAKPRLVEDTARSGFYAGAGQKDALPEHQARRNVLPHITAST